MNTGINPNVIEEIRTFARLHEIEQVLLFGSRARGDFRRTSDIDLAVRGEIISDLHWMWTKRLPHC